MIDAHPTGDWSADACRTVARELTRSQDLGEHREGVVNVAVEMHFATYARGEAHGFPTSPQHLLAQLHSFGAILSAQKEALEDQQRFRLVGLDRLAETFAQVEAMQASLATQRTRLAQMNEEANERLQCMVHDQQAAETRREASLALQASLHEQEAAVAAQRQSVLQQLAEAEPAVLDAQAAVSNIKKQHLTELRSLANPPAPVKSTMESVCILLGHRIDGWKSVQAILRRDDFIASVVHLDTQQAVPRAVRERLTREYLSRDEYRYEIINHASKACGPLARWVMAQVHYADILERVAPLRAEVAEVEARAAHTKAEAAQAADAIAQLEASIDACKTQYAALISDIQATKSEMERVEQRVARSTRLLAGLDAERARWERGRAEFDGQVRTLVGDALLSAALVAYAGFFEQGVREALWAQWEAMLDAAHIPHRTPLSVRDWLVSADAQAAWHAHGLPSDALALDNAVIMEHCTRYPLLIDPTGDAAQYVQRRYAAQKLAVASCRDAGFVKVLESALRFGTPLLLHDAEHMDPVLLPVLKQERRRTGGRVLVRVAQQDVDCAPSFRLFLATRDPAIALPAHLFCRVQLVNFTTTRKSLQAQALQRVLRAERPDVEAQRAQVAAAQGEFQRRLAHLEHALLAALNDAQGHLLESDHVVTTLETLKAEAADVQAKAADAAALATHVQRVTDEYEPLAEAASAVYFALQDLGALRPHYQWDLAFFWRVVERVLAAPGTPRLAHLTAALFREAYTATTPSLLQEDYVVLAALLARIARDDAELDVLLAPDLPDAPYVRRVHLDRTQRADAWAAYAAGAAPEADATPLEADADADADAAADEAARLVRRAIAVRIVRPDRAGPALERALEAVLRVPLYDAPALAAIVAATPAAVPLALCSLPGHDASGRVARLARAERVTCAEVALGAPEGEAAAERALAHAARVGEWVLVQNAHLALPWLAQLAPRLAALQPHASARVLVTCELSARLPRAALRAAHVVIHEPPAGLKAALLANLRALEVRAAPPGPPERARLYFLAAVLHAVVVERMRYVPLGWSTAYEFHDVDFAAALDVIDAWTQHAAGGKAHLAPQHVPWDALRTLLQQAVYGAKLDRAPDRAMLDTLVERLFVPAAFDAAFVLAPDDARPLCAPDGTRHEHFVAWARALPEPQPVHWLLLAPDAERSVAAARTHAALARLAALREPPEIPAAHAAHAADWPAAAARRRVAAGAPADAGLAPFWAREQASARAALECVHTQLAALVAIAEGRAKRTNDAAALVHHVVHDRVPDAWRTHDAPRSLGLGAWLADLGARAVHAGTPPARAALHRLFHPRAFLTATRQAAARATGASLEQLQLAVHVGDTDAPGTYAIEDLLLDGAECTADGVRLNDGATTRVERSGEPAALPVYLDADRAVLLLRTPLPAARAFDASLAQLRAVALRAA
ncbi:hypothetical protein MOBT1_000753 [Malassezia obtusa]|uniref:Dynein heavy chain, cytoplasmic n=1 Tax=Malassezia obtusa TaxID=76774 RepID=A0AAF0IQZ4_9BASI|nr:hypothetical protein MOBT1_000753 [Malassezia obtusa]